MRRILIIGIIILLTAASQALGDVAALSYTDPYAMPKTVAPSKQYINPSGAMSLYLTAGLDRKVGYVLKDGNGQTVAEGVSDLISGGDTFTVLGQTYYGKVMTVPSSLAEGSYTLAARILDSAGTVVATQSYPLVVDLTAPEATGIWWLTATASGLPGEITSGRLMGPNHIQKLTLAGVNDALSGVSALQFESYDLNNNQAYHSKGAWYDAAAQTVGIGTGVAESMNGIYLPNGIDGPIGLRFIITDKAGNRKISEIDVKYNGSNEPDPELIAIYNPNVTTEFIAGSGLVGYEAYSPGMTLHDNPMQLLYRVAKSNWTTENPDYGLKAKQGAVVYTDANYVYVRFTAPYDAGGALNTNVYAFYSPGWYSTHKITYDLVLSPAAPQTPSIVSWQIYEEGNGWRDAPQPGVNGYIGQYNTPVAITQARVVAEARDYAQIFQINASACTIPIGETSCTIEFAVPYVAEPGAMYCLIKPIQVSNEAGTLKSPPQYLWMYWDLIPPSITSYSKDEYEKTISFNAVEPQVGTLNGTSGMHSGWITARNVATQEEVPITAEMYPVSGDNYQFTGSYASLPEGEYEFTLWVKDNFANTASMTAGSLTLDQGPPVVKFYKNAVAFSSHGQTDSLGRLSFTVTDAVDQSPQVESVRLTGGPQSTDVYLAYHQQSGVYTLEYPVLYPSAGQEYVLTVKAKDDSGNTVVFNLPFTYAPPEVELSSVSGGLKLPALAVNIVHNDGSNALYSEPVTIEGSPIAGVYDLVVVSAASSTSTVVINNLAIAPGEQKTITGYDFGANGGRLSLPMWSEQAGQANLLITSMAPNFPVLAAALTIWQPQVQLSPSPGWSVQSLVELQKISVQASGGTPCQMTMNYMEAQGADPIDAPKCLVEFTQKPSGYSVRDGLLQGYLDADDPLELKYQVSIYNGGQKYILGTGSQAIERKPITAVSVSTALTPGTQVYRKVQEVTVNIQSSGSVPCKVAGSVAEAQSLAATETACLVNWTQQPDGMQADGATGVLSGYLVNEGVQSASYSVDLYTPAGTVPNIQTGSIDLTAVNPPLPTMSIDPGLYGEKVNETTFVTSALETGEVGAVRFKAEIADVKLTLQLEGTAEGTVTQEYASANPVQFTKYFKVSPMTVWESQMVKAKLYYSNLPEVAAEKIITVTGVPSQRIQAIMTSPREVLDTEGVPVRVAIGLSTSSGQDPEYDANRDGAWEVRFGYLDRQNEFQPLTEFEAADQGVLEKTLTGFERGNTKLAAEARLTPAPEASYYSRTIRSNTVYSIVLKGAAPDGQIISRHLSGPAPLRSVMSLQASSDDRAVMGDITWQMSGDNGVTWSDLEVKAPYQASVEVSAGTYLVRAKMTNVKSQAVGYTESVQLIAYDVPQIEISAPPAVITGTPVTLQAEVIVGEVVQAADDLVVQWYNNNTKELEHTGVSYTLTPKDETTLSYTIMARMKVAPETDSSAWAKKNIAIRVMPPRAPYGVIIATGADEKRISSMEYNTVAPQTYHLATNLSLQQGLDKNMYTIKGEWELPDGTIDPAPELTYSPTADDAGKRHVVIKYHAWIEGFKEETTTTIMKGLSVLTYDWPTFGMDVKYRRMVAPATVLISVMPSTGQPSKLEDPEYTWNLPEGVEKQRESDHGRVVQLIFPTAGEYSISAYVKDARGSVATATGTVQLSQAEPFMVEFQPILSNALKREPLDVVMRPRVSGGHPEDRLIEYIYSVDDPKAVVASTSSSGVIKGLTAGNRTIHLHAISKMGKVVDIDYPIEVIPNILPTCEITSRVSGDYMYHTASCTDSDGRVTTWKWYLDEQFLGSSRTIRRGKNDPAGVLKFEATDDAGGIFSTTVQ